MLTHRQVVEIAYKWLLKNGGVGIAFKELKSIDAEIPDLIGFDSEQSILIEVKVSRSDFLSDKKKPHRAKGMGNWRFYCCPKGLIKINELPAKWGLIYIDEKGKARIEYDCRRKKIKEECVNERCRQVYPEGFYYRVVRAAENWFEADVIAERRIMYTALRRLHLRGRIEEIYQTPDSLTPNRT